MISTMKCHGNVTDAPHNVRSKDVNRSRRLDFWRLSTASAAAIGSFGQSPCISAVGQMGSLLAAEHRHLVRDVEGDDQMPPLHGHDRCRL